MATFVDRMPPGYARRSPAHHARDPAWVRPPHHTRAAGPVPPRHASTRPRRHVVRDLAVAVLVLALVPTVTLGLLSGDPQTRDAVLGVLREVEVDARAWVADLTAR